MMKAGTDPNFDPEGSKISLFFIFSENIHNYKDICQKNSRAVSLFGRSWIRP
jgi:hypothetical protein